MLTTVELLGSTSVKLSTWSPVTLLVYRDETVEWMQLRVMKQDRRLTSIVLSEHSKHQALETETPEAHGQDSVSQT